MIKSANEEHIRTYLLISLFGFALIFINAVWDEWMPYGGYLFFAEVIAFCGYVSLYSYLHGEKSNNV